MYTRSKYIDVRYYYVKEKVAARQIVVHYKCTADMVADVLTKGLHRPKHENFSSSMGLVLKRLRPGEDVGSVDAYAMLLASAPVKNKLICHSVNNL